MLEEPPYTILSERHLIAAAQSFWCTINCIPRVTVQINSALRIRVPVFIGSRTGPPCARFLALRDSTIEALQS